MKSNILLTPPAVEPVSLVELKAHARIEDSSDDSLLSALIVAARQWAEAYTRRAFVAQTWALYLSREPRGDKIVLPRGPLLSVSKVLTFDEDDTASEWAATNYYVNCVSMPGEVVLRAEASWPVAARRTNGFAVEYVAGYGANADDVPREVRLAMMQLALHWYENRGEALTSGSYARAPLTIEALLNPYRVIQVGGSCV